jgi:lantibiotic leader peptide-processing serine protease
MQKQQKLSAFLSIGILSMLAISACSDRAVPVGPQQLSRQAAAIGDGVPTGRSVVVFKDTSSIPLAGVTLIQTLGGKIEKRWDDIGVAFVSGLSLNALSTLSGSSLVSLVGSDRFVNWLPATKIGSVVAAADGSLVTGDPSNASYYKDGTQWGMRVIGADKAWKAGYQGTPGVRVAIVDTGIDYTHRELVGLVDKSASASFASVIVSEGDVGVDLGIEPQQPGDEPYMDNHFHGTHVAATVASNGISVAGVAPHVTLIAVKVLSMTGSGSFEGVASGIRHAAGPANADVINMSLGANVPADAEGVPALLEMMRRVIRAAEKSGTIVISAAGNDALDLDVGNTVSTPCEQSTICVSATGPLMQRNFDQHATYTNYGITAIHVAAPGGNASDTEEYVNQDLIISACSSRASESSLNACRINAAGGPHLYAYAAGTSMATPHVVGAAALIKSANPQMSVNGLKNAILHSADDVQDAGRDVYTNWGRINVARALGLQ